MTTSATSSYEIAPAGDFVLVTLTGRAQAETVFALLDELEALGTGRAPLRLLFDESKLQAGEMGPLETARISDYWNRMSPALQSAWIAVYAPSPSIFGLNRMAQGHKARPNDRFGLFSDRDAATDWLRAAGVETV